MIEVVYNIDGMRQLAAENTALKDQVALLKHALDECAYDVLARSGKGHEAIRAAYATLATPQVQDKDGERYRWLTLTSDSNKLMVIDVLTQRLYFGYEADEAIDAAMKESK